MEELTIMAKGKKSFVVYTSWNTFLEDLNNEQKGKWLDWVMRYVNDEWENKEIEYPDDPMVKMSCKMVKDVLKRDLKKYEAKVDRIMKNGKQYRNEVEEIKTDNDTEIGADIEANIVGVNVNDNVNVNVNDNDINTDKLINDKSCVHTHDLDKSLNFSKVDKLKAELDSVGLDYHEFKSLHRLVQGIYRDKELPYPECVVLSDLLKEMDSKYDGKVVMKAWLYSWSKSKESLNRVGYIKSILEKNIQRGVN